MRAYVAVLFSYLMQGAMHLKTLALGEMPNRVFCKSLSIQSRVYFLSNGEVRCSLVVLYTAKIEYPNIANNLSISSNALREHELVGVPLG